MSREIRAVRTALEGLEEDVLEESDALKAQSAQPQNSEGVKNSVEAGSKAPQHDSEEEIEQSGTDKLQKAGLEQRLKDLRAKRTQWKVNSLSIYFFIPLFLCQ